MRVKSNRSHCGSRSKKSRRREFAQAERNLNRYRSTWPNNLETYFDWLKNIEEMLEPTWGKISYKKYDETQDTNIVVHSKESIDDYLSIKINRDNTMTIEYFLENLLDGQEEILVSDVTIFYSKNYEAFKVEADYEGKNIKLFYMKDSNAKKAKGFSDLVRMNM